MCKIIDRIEAGFTAEEVPDLLELIGNAIEQGKPAEKYQTSLDKLLGTEMEPRDAYAEAHWEADHRNTDEG
jgi:hypothetical protein